MTTLNELSFDRSEFWKTTLFPNKYKYLSKTSTGIHVQVVIVVIVVVVVVVIVIVVRVDVVVDSWDDTGRQVEGDHEKTHESESRKIVTFCVATSGR